MYSTTVRPCLHMIEGFKNTNDQSCFEIHTDVKKHFLKNIVVRVYKLLLFHKLDNLQYDT